MSFGLAIGIVINFGGILGQGEGATSGDSSSGSDGGSSGGSDDGGSIISAIADAVGGSVDRRGLIQVPWRNIPRALRALRMLPLLLPSLALAADGKSGGGSILSRLAIYVGPVLDVGFIYFTIGACLGGFGCLAGGLGLKLGNFGIGVLFPFWKWWGHSHSGHPHMGASRYAGLFLGLFIFVLGLVYLSAIQKLLLVL